jgi:positive regulator of sigma E activity
MSTKDWAVSPIWVYLFGIIAVLVLIAGIAMIAYGNLIGIVLVVIFAAWAAGPIMQWRSDVREKKGEKPSAVQNPRGMPLAWIAFLGFWILVGIYLLAFVPVLRVLGAFEIALMLLIGYISNRRYNRMVAKGKEVRAKLQDESGVVKKPWE